MVGDTGADDAQTGETGAAAAPEDPPLPPEDPTPATTPEVDVVARVPRVLDHVAGSATVVPRAEMRQLAPQSSSDVLRTIPGVNVVAEDGMGLRLNVGFRGLDPNRSRKVLVLEDGMPVTLNPYGSPEMYYTPPVERMERIDVIKGSGQILWGPQTVGGVINYVTRDPPRKLGGHADVRYGAAGYLLAHAGIGNTHGPIGWWLNVLHRRFDGPRRLDLALTDVLGKLRLQITPTSTLTLKLNVYDESSRATYLGLTQSQFDSDPTLSLADHDRFLVRRYALGVVHQQVITDAVLLQTSLYAYQTGRDWRRQEYDRADLGADYERICDGLGRCGARGDPGIAPDSAGGSIFFRRTVANRNRLYAVAGIEPRLTWAWAAQASPVAGELTALVRYHHESARDQIFVGAHPTADAGDLRDDERRTGRAFAALLQHRFTLWDRLRITPGLRSESFWSDRHTIRQPQALPTGQAVGQDVDASGRASSYALIPALGIAFDLRRDMTLYGGVHRGYAPPRSRDAVSASGQNLRLEPEKSWNTELGAQIRKDRWLRADVAAFFLEFANQIIPPSEAAGAVSGHAFNAGHSRHAGLEAALTVDPASLLGGTSVATPLTVNYTYLPLAEMVGGLYGGNRLPYAPRHILWAQARLAHRVGLSAQASATYVSEQLGDKENTLAPSRDGLVGRLPGYLSLDARLAYTRSGLTFYVVGKNLTDRQYVSSRAPSGIQPAGFRHVFAGVERVW